MNDSDMELLYILLFYRHDQFNGESLKRLYPLNFGIIGWPFTSVPCESREYFVNLYCGDFVWLGNRSDLVLTAINARITCQMMFYKHISIILWFIIHLVDGFLKKGVVNAADA